MKLVQRGLGSVRAFVADVRGIAAVEFGYLVPVMLLLFVGILELSRAIAADRRFSQSTSMIADLVSRESTITRSDLNAIYEIVDQIMGDFKGSSLKISVVPIMVNPTDDTEVKVYPSTLNRPGFQGGAVPPQCSSFGLSTGIVSAGGTAIVVDATYSYEPIFSGYLLNTMTWTNRSISTPRDVCVDFDGNNCAITCF